MIKINQNIQFVIVSAYFSRWSLFETPNGVFILKSLLEKYGISSSRITLYSLDKIAQKNEQRNLLSKNRKKNIIFLISICERREIELKKIFEQISEIRKYFYKSLTVIGGITVTSAPEIFIRNKAADIIALGEAEIFIPHFFKAIREKKLQSMPNAYILKNKNYIFGGRGKLLSPSGIYESQKALIKSLIKVPESEKRENFIPLEFSRGCCFNCTFCYEQLIRKNLDLKPNEWMRSISPKEAARLTKIAVTQGFKKIVVADDAFTNHSDNWLREFLKHIKMYFPQSHLPFNKRIIFRFSACPIDFQREYIIKFIKGLTFFFQLRIDIGVEALDKETLSKFNKPHKNNPAKIINKILDSLKLYEKERKVGVFPELIQIHPWITFQKLRQVAKFWYQWKSNMNHYIVFLAQQRLWMISEKLEIVDILKKEKLFLRLGGEDNFKFAYAKKVLFPKNENDTDLGRFVSFAEHLGGYIPVKEAHERYDDLEKRVFDENSRKEADSTNKKLYQFYIKVLNKAEKKWTKLTYQEYERESQLRIGEFLKILNEGSENLKKLV